MPGTETMLTKPVEKQHTDTVVNFLIRIACQVTSPQLLPHTHTRYSSAIHSACQVGRNCPDPSVVKEGHTWWLS